MRFAALPAVPKSSDMADTSIVYELCTAPPHFAPPLSFSRTMAAGAGARAPTSKLYRRYEPPPELAVIDQSEPAEFTLPEKKIVLA